MVGICSEDSSFRTKLVQTLLTILYLLSLINHGGAEHVVLLNHGATGSESEQGRDLSHQDSFPFSVSSWEEARVRKELQASREIPAIRGVATHHFFEYASQVAVELLKLNFKKVSLPPLETYVNIPVVGEFRLNLDDISLDDLDVSSTQSGIFLGANESLVITVTDLDAVANGDFHFDRISGFPPIPIRGGGHITITASGGKAVFPVMLVNSKGRAFLLPRAPAQVSFSGIRVQISNVPLAFLFNFIAAIAASPIQSAITQQVAQQVTERLPAAANQLLEGIPEVVQVGDLSLNISLARRPLVTPDSVTLYDWGRFFPEPSASQDCPYASGPASPPVLTPGGEEEGRMLVADIDESLPNCLTWALFQRGDLDRQVEGPAVPGYALYTNTWLPIVPGLPKKYPNRWMSLKVHVPEPPISRFVEGKGVLTKGNATLSFFLANNTSSFVPHAVTVPYPAENRTASLHLSRQKGTGSGKIEPSLTSSDSTSDALSNAMSNALRVGTSPASGIKGPAFASGIAAGASHSTSWATSGTTSSLQSIEGGVGSHEVTRNMTGTPGTDLSHGYRRSLKAVSINEDASSAESVPQGPARLTEYHRDRQSPERPGLGGHIILRDQAQGSGMVPRSPEGAADGDHLFTLDLSVELIASNITFVPVSEEKPDVFRLAVTMHIVQGSLWHRVVDSTVGPLDESGLDFLIGLVGFLVEQEVNGDILANLVLPDVAHIKLVQPAVRAVDGSVRVIADVKYV